MCRRVAGLGRDDRLAHPDKSIEALDVGLAVAGIRGDESGLLVS
jgi:hypothetical protein